MKAAFCLKRTATINSGCAHSTVRFTGCRWGLAGWQVGRLALPLSVLGTQRNVSEQLAEMVSVSLHKCSWHNQVNTDFSSHFQLSALLSLFTMSWSSPYKPDTVREDYFHCFNEFISTLWRPVHWHEESKSQVIGHDPVRLHHSWRLGSSYWWWFWRKGHVFSLYTLSRETGKVLFFHLVWARLQGSSIRRDHWEELNTIYW